MEERKRERRDILASYCPDHAHAGVYRKKSGPHLGEYCKECDRWIRWVPQGLKGFVWPIGAKHRGDTLQKIADTDPDYLRWAAENLSSPSLKKKAQEALRELIPSAQGGSIEEKEEKDSTGAQQTDLFDPTMEDLDDEDVPW